MKDIQAIFQELDRLLELKEKIIIAIDGRSAAGKSSLASAIGKKYDCNLFHMDDFFLPASQKTEERLKQPGGNVDYIRFKNVVMDKLKEEASFKYQIFDCKVQRLKEERTIVPKQLNIIEGAYSMHPLLIDDYDLKIFLDIDDTTQRERILKRNGKDMYQKFMNEWIPLEDIYFNELGIREKADIHISLPVT